MDQVSSGGNSSWFAIYLNVKTFLADIGYCLAITDRIKRGNGHG
jgi:hypothetical protein